MRFKIKNKKIFLFLTCLIITPLFAHCLTLSQESVVQTVLKHSLEYQKIQVSEKSHLQNLVEAEAFLDWRLFLQGNFNSREQNTLNFFENPLLKDQTVLSGVEKKFLTGTQFKIQYSHLQIEKSFNLEFKKISSSPSTTFRQQLVLEVEQDLLRNIFGYADRMKLNIAFTQAEKQKIKILEETEDLILQAIQQFWLTYISHLSLQLKISKKKDYTDLTRITREKHKYGYIRPGELSQIQAELERTKQELILQKTDYENQLKKLLNLLNSKTIDTVKFITNNKLPSPPVFNKNVSQTPRKVLLMEKNLFIQEQQLKIQKSNTWPTLKLFGSYGIGGYDTDFSSAFEGLTERVNKNHAVGIKLSYNLPSTSTRRKRIAFSEQAVETSHLEMEITKKEFERLTDSTQKTLQSLYEAFKSSEKIHKLRTQSYKEIRKAFLQGRLNVFELISAKEFSLISEMQKANFKAQYYQALAYVQAVRDKLITLYQQL